MLPPTRQSAFGNQGTVVQIVGDNNAVTIAGAAGLFLRSYTGAAFVSAPADAAKGGAAGYTPSGRRELRVLSPYNPDLLPLSGRAAPLARLTAWLDEAAPLSVHVLIGAGGAGKTRLASELARHARAQGWEAGFAAGKALGVFVAHGCSTAWKCPTLVIVDYAAANCAELADWLRSLVHQDLDEDGPKLRLLLLERTGGPGSIWWRELFEVADPTGEAVAELLAADAPLRLGALADAQERYAVFAAALEAAGRAPPGRTAALDATLHAISLGGIPLFLAMFGLTAARQGMAAARGLGADTLARALARQELERIGRVWKAHGLPDAADPPLHVHLAAVATLCEGLDAVGTHAMIARESAALHQAIPVGQTADARAVLREALAGEGDRTAPILPDIVGEAAMIEAWARLPDRGAAAVQRAAAAGYRPAVIRVVIRACQDFLIRGEETPLHWLRELQATATQLEGLIELAEAFPRDSVGLREPACALAQALVDACRRLPADTGQPLLAAALNDLSKRLADLSRREEALRTIVEAVHIRLGLAARNPDAFGPGLAGSLHNLSNHLAAFGRRAEALGAIEEAANLYRSLAVRDPHAGTPGLAMSLISRSNRLAALGRREDALGAIEEAANLYRSLAAGNPDAFTPDLAMSLNNLSGCLADLGRREDALGAVEEAVGLYRGLAVGNPDAFGPDLARSLWVRADRLDEHGRVAEAAAANREAIATLTPVFLRYPSSFASIMDGMAREYLDRCARAGSAPDEALLAPITDLLTKIAPEKEPP